VLFRNEALSSQYVKRKVKQPLALIKESKTKKERKSRFEFFFKEGLIEDCSIYNKIETSINIKNKLKALRRKAQIFKKI